MNFQLTVLKVAGVILILALGFVGYSLYYLNKKAKYPPVIGECPDYWERTEKNGKYVCTNPKKLGSCGNEMDFSGVQYSGAGGNCSKSQWAKKCNLSWDGITNIPDVCKPSA
jgi:hypothetical protein